MTHPLFKFLDQRKPILVFGRDGQVGKALQISLKYLNVPVVFMGRSDCDLSNELAIRDILNCYEPQVIINAAAYTSVDKAESERELAFAINAKAPAVMAHHISNVTRGILVHYSTDYVFADYKKAAYLESDEVGPAEKLSIYGKSKLEGEREIQKIFHKAHYSKSISNKKFLPDNLSRYYILRTSWVYGDGANFIRTILRLAGERDELKIVADQVGVPSSAEWLAEVSVKILKSGVESGIYHAVPDGEITWHDLAVFAIETAVGCSNNIVVNLDNILPIDAADYPLPAPRPYNSRLNNQKLKKVLTEIEFNRQYPQWQDQVRDYVVRIIKEALKS